MKFYVKHTTYTKDGNKWILEEQEEEKRQITLEEYELFKTEKWQGDRREYGYTPAGKQMTKLTNVEPVYKANKSVRVFTFEI